VTLELLGNAERRAVPAFGLLVMAPVCRLRLAAAALLLAFLASADAQRPGESCTDHAQYVVITTAITAQQAQHLVRTFHGCAGCRGACCKPLWHAATASHVHPLA
jgi:hypothetical protein